MSKPIDQDLLPCPFCGKQPKEYDQIGYSSVNCKPCGFSIKVKSMDGPPYAPELWNRRASALPAGVAVPEVVGWVWIESRNGQDWDMGFQFGSEKPDFRVSHAGQAFEYSALVARSKIAAPHPVSGEQPYPEGVAEALERTDWTPEEALRWYAEGRHFDTVDGRARIIDTGSVASNALKHASLEYLEMKGDAELHELRQAVSGEQKAAAYLHQVVQGDGEPDEALSFEPDSFPLSEALGFRSIACEPLYRGQPAAQDVAGLVAALMSCAKASSAAEVGLIVDAALAAHRAQQGEQPS